MARIVTVRRDDYTLAYGGDILPNARYDLDLTADVEYTPRLNVGEVIGSSAEYGEVTGRGSVAIYEKTDPGDDRDFSLPGETGEVANMHFGCTYDDGDTVQRTAEGVYLSHLKVDEDHRRQGYATLLFDAYRVVALYIDGYAGGAIGAGSGSEASFLRRQGLLGTDYWESDKVWGMDGVAWETPASALVNAEDATVTVEDGVEFDYL